MLRNEEENKKSEKTSFRKLHHLEICLQEEIESEDSTRLEDFHFVHKALCDIDFEEIDTSMDLWGKKLTMPLLAAAMTGGHPEVRATNEAIALAAQKFHFAMGLGSERAALEKNIPYITESFGVVRKLAPEALLIANLGAAQFAPRFHYGLPEMQKAVDLLQAQALAIHVNPAQEAIQREGDTSFRGFWFRLQELLPQVSVPVVLKEVGSGFSREDARIMENSSLAGVDIGGKGGTSWIAVEALRAQREKALLPYEVGKTFWNWGIPTALSLVEVRSVSNKIVIATGGVRNGLEAAKLIALGADLVGMALPFLKAAHEGPEAIEFLVQKFHRELKTCMFLTGCRTLSELRRVPLVVTNFSQEWMQQRQIDPTMPWRK